ncbi:MAG: hypothetical protein KDB27_20550 [Planctomycetales bacterium]|nr:hypothetical protein [Planctomycetales bacterium]
MVLRATKPKNRVRSVRHLRNPDQLEPREMLTGLSWMDTSQLTISFAPDGTDIAGVPSSLHEKFDSIARRNDWTESILEAFQVGAAPTTANVGFVAERLMPTAIDSEPINGDGLIAGLAAAVDVNGIDGAVNNAATGKGYPFGTPGPRTQDDRFGDIRIGARPLSNNVKAIAIANDELISGTWAGDVIFNSEADIENVDEIFALALHEAGHVFGLSHNGNPDSPLFEHGQPESLRPTRDDRLEMRQRHGTRVRDQYDLGVGNDAIDLATIIDVPATNSFTSGSVPAVVFASIHTGNDVDYYQFPRLANYAGNVKVQLKTRGISLLSPKISIVTQDGVPVVSRSSNNPRGANLTLAIDSVDDQRNDLFIRVESAQARSDVFSVGDYSLAVTFSGRNVISDAAVDSVLNIRNRDLLQAAVSTFFDDSTPVKQEPSNVPEDPATADIVAPKRGFAPFTYYEAIDSITNAEETDYFRFNTLGLRDAFHVNISVRPLRNGTLVPQTFVVGEDRSIVPSEILVNGNGELIIQAELTPGQNYAVGVRAEDGLKRFQRGDYRVGVYFTDDPVEMKSFAEGVVNDNYSSADGNDPLKRKQTVHRLHVGQSQLFHFSLAAQAPLDVTPMLTNGVAAYFRNESSEIVHRITTPVGKTRTTHSVFLRPGTYTVQVFPLNLTRSKLGPAKYLVSGTQISDPFSIDPDDPTDDPFDCPGEDGVFCYPGGIESEEPFLWEEFLDTFPEIPSLQIEELIATLLGDWWQWYWGQSGENGPALAYDDTYATAPNSPLVVDAANGVLSNDIDPEDDELAATLHETASKGVLDLDYSGAFSYTPNSDYVGLDQFVYVAYDFNQDPINRMPAEYGLVTIEVVGQSGIKGDFNGDGVLDLIDVNLLSAAILSSQEYVFDLDNDGEVNAFDLEFLVLDLIGTVRGDANLDGVFGSDDLVSVFVFAEYEDQLELNSTWATGDWNGDGEFDSSDLVAAFQDGMYAG